NHPEVPFENFWYFAAQDIGVASPAPGEVVREIIHSSIVNYFPVGSAPDPTQLLGPAATSGTLPGVPGDLPITYATYAWEKITVPGGSATVSIADAQPIYQSTIGPLVPAAFKLTLSQALDHQVSVDFSTQDGTAKAGHDYVAETGTITFAPGETSKTVL